MKLVAILFLFAVFFFAGCTPAPALRITTADGTRITQTGEAVRPATVSIGNLTLTGPAAAAPATPKEKAAGTLALLLPIGAAIGVFVAIGGFWWGGKLLMIGGASFAAGCLIVNWISSIGGLALIGAGAALAIAGPWIWRTQIQPLIPAAAK